MFSQTTVSTSIAPFLDHSSSSGERNKATASPASFFALILDFEILSCLGAFGASMLSNLFDSSDSLKKVLEPVAFDDGVLNAKYHCFAIRD